MERDVDAGVGYVELLVEERLGAAFRVAGDGPELVQAGGGDGPLGSSGEDGLDGGDDRGWGRRRAEVCGHFVFSAAESGGGASRLALQAHGQGAGVASGVRSTGATPAGPRDWGSEC